MEEILSRETASAAIVVNLAPLNPCVFGCHGFPAQSAKVLAKLHYCTAVGRRQPARELQPGKQSRFPRLLVEQGKNFELNGSLDGHSSFWPQLFRRGAGKSHIFDAQNG
jgi:hypothetical protein